ncbi:IclR family transcriptional regulator [Parapusillimonas granuli]|uniref:HTH domain-containing protein n=1 Tax=Parapusillimonas granuli TaxID=380911 RepID=A0A853G0I4_9BURK|nr:IclR family transcriptional regulator C-terminal domain-containing protein [Parapusillimonas granuli]MBB5213736.1 DNA-binding IclR family transcriptional regulator [Parapusillimonas granuli]NYT48570.1 HTH domain-containing protein [Parapusillimonas granuli]
MKPKIRPRNRILHIFQLFEQQHTWSVEEIAHEMGTSTSSAYRDVQELSQAGFLIPIVGSRYVLGPAFVQFDRVVRISDPLIRLGTAQMRELLDRTTQRAVAVLSRRYRDQVMCVHQETGNAPYPLTSYERGVAMPLFVGATSKAILAHLNDRTLEKIYLENEEEIKRSLHCTNWKEFRDHLAEIRKAGVAVTTSEVAKGRVGIAAPIFASKQVIGGLSLVVNEPDFEDECQRAAVISAAQAITDALAKEEPWIARS